MNDMKMQHRIATAIQASVQAVQALDHMTAQIAAVATTVVEALQAGGKVLTAGNGGSAAEAMHMAEELVGRFRGDRCSLPGISLAADSTTLTCIGNDYGFDYIFSRQVEGVGCPGDVLVLFSTSGKSENLLLALEAAHRKGITTVAVLGGDGGTLGGRASWELCVAGESSERIQEAQQVVMHIILEEVELAFARA